MKFKFTIERTEIENGQQLGKEEEENSGDRVPQNLARQYICSNKETSYAKQNTGGNDKDFQTHRQEGDREDVYNVKKANEINRKLMKIIDKLNKSQES